MVKVFKNYLLQSLFLGSSNFIAVCGFERSKEERETSYFVISFSGYVKWLKY